MSAGCRDHRGASSPAPTAYFILLELVLLVAFFVTLGAVGARLLDAALARALGAGAVGTLVPARDRAAPGARAIGSPVLASGLVLLGGLALRIVVIFGAQM